MISGSADYDLAVHQERSKQDLTYLDPETNERYLPWVIEPAVSVERIFITLLLDAYDEDLVNNEPRVVLRHALRNALLPTVTVIGLTYGGLLSGAVLTETIFSWPGLGRYVTNSMISVDIPAVLGVTLVIALIYSVANLIVDVLYAYLDPQIRYT